MHQPSPVFHASSPPEKHSLIATLKGPINPQNQSILFSGIPPEIRNRIFSFALYSYDDLSRPPFPENGYYTRPGYRYHQRVATPLLETCWRIYSETHDLPISRNEHVFWYSPSRGPDPFAGDDQAVRYFARFTKEQREAVVHVHLFVQLFWLEGDGFKRWCSAEDIRMKHLKLTIRHTDWWYWESREPLEIKSCWGDHLKSIQGLQTLDVELETMEKDKEQLEVIVNSMLSWRFRISNTRSFVTEENPIQQDKYIGQSSFAVLGGSLTYYDPPTDEWLVVMSWLPKPDFPPHLSYVVSTLRWRVVENQ